MKALSLSDTVIQFIYSTAIRERFSDIDILFGCGDLPYYYLEYVVSVLDAPLFFVRGNHDKVVEYNVEGQRVSPTGGFNAHRQVIRYNDLIIAGVEGSLRYRPGMFQYSQQGMFRHVLALTPSILINRILYGRYLDVFLSHAPAQGIHDAEDLPHQGVKAFRWFINVFQPAYYFHGHIHIYNPETVAETMVGKTRVINTYGFRETELELERGKVLKRNPSSISEKQGE